MTAAEPTAPMTAWSTVTEDEIFHVPELGELLTELAEQYCVCPHQPDNHPLEVLHLITGKVLGFRLGACRVRHCRCNGGR